MYEALATGQQTTAIESIAESIRALFGSSL